MVSLPSASAGIGTLIAVLTLLATTSPLRSAHSKIERIEYDQAPRGSIVRLSESELLAYAEEQAKVIAPGAIRGASLKLTPGYVETTARINFLKVRQAQGHTDNWMLRQLLDGERPVRIRARLQSGRGRARVDVEQVEISGVTMEGNTLDFLLRQFVIPNFPEARTGAWFELGHRIERIDVGTGVAVIRIGGASGR